jgi:rubrerythrin
MADMYAGSEILQMAVEIEKKGKAFYDGVVHSVKDSKAREIFQFLADEEVKHEQLFKKMLGDLEIGKDDNPYDNTEMILYFRSLIDRKIFPTEQEGAEMKGELGNIAAAIHIALSLEKDAILFFNELHQVAHERDRDVIQRIIVEEREHIRRILQLKKELHS